MKTLVLIAIGEPGSGLHLLLLGNYKRNIPETFHANSPTYCDCIVLQSQKRKN